MEHNHRQQLCFNVCEGIEQFPAVSLQAPQIKRALASLAIEAARAADRPSGFVKRGLASITPLS